MHGPLQITCTSYWHLQCQRPIGESVLRQETSTALTNTSYSETSHPLAEKEILSKPWEVRADVNTCLTDHVHFCAHLFFFLF